MKLVEGENFLDRIRNLGDSRLEPKNLAENLEILLKVCDAVAYAHNRGVVHRDLKPSNVMVGAFGEVYVMDWGIALRIAEPRPEPVSFDERGVLGTPTFVAPEQIEDPDGVDGRADIYCLGGLLYALLTSRPPHQGRTPLLRLMASSHGRIAPPEEIAPDPRLPLALSRIAMRALARHPEDRYPTVGAFKADVARFLHGGWHLPTRSYPAGAVVVREGDGGDEAFVLHRGRCRVESAAAGPIRELGPGDVFGELALLTPGGRRTSTVVAITELEVQVVTREVLSHGLGLQSWMGVFVQAMAGRFAELESRLAKI
jgi:serine/threonine-protein kinase